MKPNLQAPQWNFWGVIQQSLEKNIVVAKVKNDIRELINI